MSNNVAIKYKIDDEFFFQNIPLNGILIGSSDKCDLVLKDEKIKTEHARIFKDPFNRWIIESIHSQIPLVVNRKKGGAFSIGAGDTIEIETFKLFFIENTITSIIPPTLSTTSLIIDDEDTPKTFTDEAHCQTEFSRSRLKELDKITDTLANLSESKELYPAICEILGKSFDTIALVVKVPHNYVSTIYDSKILFQSTSSLPYNIGFNSAKKNELPGIHLSRTVLEHVRNHKKTFMATSNTDDNEERLSLIGDFAPRTVLAAPLAQTNTGIEILYIDQPSISFQSDALAFFAIVAKMVALSRKSLLMAEYKAEKLALDTELKTALEIQSRLIPKKLNLIKEADVALYYKPAGWVGGDYCDLYLASDNRLMFAVGDVSGKGLPAAMMMANLHSTIRSMLLFSTNPTVITNKINALLAETLLDEMFITLLIGFLDPLTGQIEYVNAGHELPLIISESGNVDILGVPTNMPIGIQKTNFITQYHTLSKGDTFAIFSDGISETFSPEGEQFGLDRLLEEIAACTNFSCQKLIDHVIYATTNFRWHAHASDDSTMLAVKWFPEQ